MSKTVLMVGGITFSGSILASPYPHGNEETGATEESVIAEKTAFGGGLKKAETKKQKQQAKEKKDKLVITDYDDETRALLDYTDVKVNGADGRAIGLVAGYTHEFDNFSELRINVPYRFSKMDNQIDTESHFVGLDVTYMWPFRAGDTWSWDIGGSIFGSASFIETDLATLKRSGNLKYGAGLWTSYTDELPDAPGMISLGVDVRVSEATLPSSMVNTGTSAGDRATIDYVKGLDAVTTVSYGFNYGIPFKNDQAIVNLEVIRSEFISSDISDSRDNQTRVSLSGSYYFSDTFEINAGVYEVYGLKKISRRGLMLGAMYKF